MTAGLGLPTLPPEAEVRAESYSVAESRAVTVLRLFGSTRAEQRMDWQDESYRDARVTIQCRTTADRDVVRQWLADRGLARDAFEFTDPSDGSLRKVRLAAEPVQWTLVRVANDTVWRASVALFELP